MHISVKGDQGGKALSVSPVDYQSVTIPASQTDKTKALVTFGVIIGNHYYACQAAIEIPKLKDLKGSPEAPTLTHQFISWEAVNPNAIFSMPGLNK